MNNYELRLKNHLIQGIGKTITNQYGTDTETHYINELFKRLVFHELLNKLNLKNLYHYRDNVKYCPGKVELNFTLNKQELDLLI